MIRLRLFVSTLMLFWLAAASLHAATITAASCSATAVQAAINAANSGDTVLVPGGTCQYTTTVFISNTKAITLDGTGNTTITTTAQNAFDISAAGNAETRLTGFNINTSGVVNDSQPPIKTHGSTSTFSFRIDHNVFTSGDASTFITTDSNGPGLIDNNSFTAGASAEMIHNIGMGGVNTAGWNDDINPGSSSMLFIENNTFTYNATGNPAYFWGTAAVQSYFGARTVIRYNTMNMVHIDQHGTPGNIGARWWEIYENTFNTGVPNASQSNYIALRGGSGVVFNNHHTGFNLADSNGAGIQLFEEDTGQTPGDSAYPFLYQIGRGIGQKYSPAYVWNNDIPAGSGSSNVQSGIDFFVSTTQPTSLKRQELGSDTSTTTYAYVPFQYPHPLQTLTPAAPTGLTVVVH